jgi:hypothetical protein
MVMTSSGKAKRNKQNARNSTGPRTPGGKLRASRNALRHGLATVADPVQSKEVDRLAAALAVICTNVPAELIRAAAAAELHLRHVRKVRANGGRDLLDALSIDPEKDGPSFLDLLARYKRLDRYEHTVIGRRKRSLRTIMR